MSVAIAHSGRQVDVSIVMPCLNEVKSLEPCIRAAAEALQQLDRLHGLRGEIVLADNGSTDGSQALGRRLGARVVRVSERGYGAALRGGFEAARGRFLVMGDADGSYDFREAVGMVEKLIAGADLCMGSRFRGRILPDAMPWKNRYIGNPVLTGVLNVLFRTRVSDAHCGLRALTADCFRRLRLSGVGMEFASEMVIKAALRGERIAEVPATLAPDLRDRPPHLRPWRDGWRHLRYLFMLSPFWLFAAPAMVAGAIGLAILSAAAWALARHLEADFFFGNYWTVLAGAMVGGAHIALILAFATHLYGVREGYRRPRPWLARMADWVTLETMVLSGAGSILAGVAVLSLVLLRWWARGLGGTFSVWPAVVGTLLLTLGAQNALGGFLLAIIGGNQARFFEPLPAADGSTRRRAPPAQAPHAVAG